MIQLTSKNISQGALDELARRQARIDNKATFEDKTRYALNW